LRQLARRWPKVERETFHLHFMEGMSADDIAHAFSCDRASVDATISGLRGRLRTLLSELTEFKSPVEPTEGQAAAYARHLGSVTTDVRQERTANGGV
jgi:hypothetical protein